MIPLSPAAREQVAGLSEYYEERGRPEAIRNLRSAIVLASDRILAAKKPFLAAPRPYPALTRIGWLWLKAGVYWIAFNEAEHDRVIKAVFHEAAYIPARLPE